MALVTINPMKSTTIGGVETLIREIQTSFDGQTIIELFQHTPSLENFSENSKVKYVSYGSNGSPAIVHKIFTKFKQRNMIGEVVTNQKANTVVIFHPNDLLYMPHHVRSASKIVLVQTNRLDVYFSGLETFVMRMLAKYVDVFTVYTEIDKQVVNECYGGWFKEVVVIPRGCKLPTAECVATPGKALITIARIHEHQKNFTGLIEIMRNLPADYTLSIFGDGPKDEIAQLEQLIEGFSNVTFYGPTSDVQSVLRKHNIFVMTSHYEGFGQTLIEARSQGLPTIAYDTFDALQWVIKKDENGYIVPPYNVDLFVNAIRTIAESKETYLSLSENAIKFARETEKENINKLWSSTLSYE
ncbi:hypothetical protein EP12_08290 [Alteromonas australica]|jgi:glycosyltransferase involved in cell wall biosynthesis|uniref:glycosyltransferase n=1 Tax=Alteromonas TaxID=226 RepID=UPI0005C41E82|nr:MULTISPECIES: glycosyltransferase [Alteromonas]AJP43664.1 hypothetical protein EP12_08290 [Alteromonas australica]QPL48531.1 glycosyltransferase [Alteromonas sp. B31-7]|tara:strand:- start:4428 stop:5495 length:1068 start_codon:yes stop_codon:yes gene_type:complete